jgi:hypothetical protein
LLANIGAKRGEFAAPAKPSAARSADVEKIFDCLINRFAPDIPPMHGKCRHCGALAFDGRLPPAARGW